MNGCKTGRTRITKGYDLPAKYVLHTVGPTEENPQDLIGCYMTTLSLAKQHKIRTIALCCVSTGIFGYPRENAGHVAMSTVRKFLQENHKSFDRVIFIVFETKDEKMYNELMPIYFPVSDPKNPPEDPSFKSYIESENRFYKEYNENLKDAREKIEKLKSELKDNEKELESKIKDVEAWFAKKCGFGKPWSFKMKDEKETEEEKKIREEKEKQDQIAQEIEDHEVCVAYGLYDEKNELKKPEEK